MAISFPKQGVAGKLFLTVLLDLDLFTVFRHELVGSLSLSLCLSMAFCDQASLEVLVSQYKAVFVALACSDS